METRRLREDEFDLLRSTPEPNDISPENTAVIAAFDGNRLVGRLAVLNVPHIEGVWIDRQYRNGTMLSRLERKAVEILRECGASAVLAVAINNKIEGYLERLGYKRIGSLWSKEV